VREEEIDVPNLTRALYHDALALSAGRHRVLLDLGCDDWLVAAEEELRSALGNLVSNAIRLHAGRRRGHDRLAAPRRGSGIQRA